MSEGWYRLTNRLGRVALGALGTEVRATGTEHLPLTGPVILAANHVSYPDFIFVEHAAITRGRYVRFMCRHDIWQQPGLAAPMSAMRHVPVDREAPAGAYLMARRLLGEGEVVGIFPEAGISHSFTIRSLMLGTASLARETGVPVIPVALWGGQRVFTVGGADTSGRRPRTDLTRGRRIDLSFGAPMVVAPDADLTEWTRGLGARLTELLEEIQGRPHHRPRPGEWAPWYPAHLGGAAPTRHEARELDSVPRSSVRPSWGPPTCGPACDGSPTCREG
jgi:1-acyl-sn-glycerol-3-phosphate acyltransferase